MYGQPFYNYDHPINPRGRYGGVHGGCGGPRGGGWGAKPEILDIRGPQQGTVYPEGAILQVPLGHLGTSGHLKALLGGSWYL